MLRELPRHPVNGIPLLILLPLLFLGSVAISIRFVIADQPLFAAAAGFVALCLLVAHFGFFMVDPNEARVLQLFGKYVGTAREAGLRWANPFYTKRKVSVRIRNF